MGSAETVESLIQKLGASSDAAELTELLMNLKTALGHYSRAELAEKVVSNENVLMEALFGCLSPNPDHELLVQNACDILKQIMGIIDPAEIISRYAKDMREGLEDHPLADVRILVITQLDKCLESEDSTAMLCSNHPSLVVAVIRQHNHSELAVATRAGNFLVKLAATTDGSELLGGEGCVAEFQNLITTLDRRSQERYRVFETLANVSVVSSTLFEKLQGNINLASTLSDIVFGDSDPLGGANALEILGTLAGTPFGLEAVTRAGVIEKIERLTQQLDSNPLSSLLFPETLKFIGKIGATQLPPPRLRQIVLETVVRADLEIYVTIVAIEALSYIGCTKEGKQYLFGKAETHECFKKARQIIENAQTEYRTRTIDAMTILFGSDEGTQACLPTWFNLLFPQISTLFDLVQQPFPDIRLSSLKFLNAVAPLEWAQRHYLRNPGVVEFLTNRDAEPDKECLIAKYKIVCIVAESQSASKLLSAENYGRLKIYKDQGPFYAAAISVVATEGSS